MRSPIGFACPPLLAATAALAVLPAGPAHAGTYTVHGCRTPDGVSVGLDGWNFSVIGEHSASIDRCAAGGAAGGALDPRFAHDHTAGVAAVFHAPADTEIQAFRLWRSAQVRPSPEYRYVWSVWQGQRDDDHAVEKCAGNDTPACSAVGNPASALSTANLVSRDGLSGVRTVWAGVFCRSSGKASVCAAGSDPVARFQLHRADVTLSDPHPPTLQLPPSGPLLGGGALSGVQQAFVWATDRGAGVRDVLFEVDGRVVGRDAIDDNGGRCRIPFTHVVPCKRDARGPVSFNTATVPDGEHKLRLIVTDATGTNSVAWGPVSIQTSNGACSADPRVSALRMTASFVRRSSRSKAKSRTVTSSSTNWSRRLRVNGTLTTPTGAPVAAARVCVMSQDGTGDAQPRPAGTLMTDGKGRFSIVLRRGPTRRVSFIHRVGGGAVSASVRVRVRAPVRLRTSRRSLRNGQTVMLRGRLPGGPRPRDGVLIEMQARRPGGYQTFGTTRTDRRGRFRFPYTFHRTVGVARYRVRARVPAQSTYPYLPGNSKPVTLTVRG